TILSLSGAAKHGKKDVSLDNAFALIEGGARPFRPLRGDKSCVCRGRDGASAMCNIGRLYETASFEETMSILTCVKRREYVEGFALPKSRRSSVVRRRAKPRLETAATAVYSGRSI